jgi:hypothetical protein
VKKGVERCFNTLKVHFAIIQNPCRLWQIDIIYEMMVACTILHNMIIENDINNHLETFFQQANLVKLKQGLTFDSFMQSCKALKRLKTHAHISI